MDGKEHCNVRRCVCACVRAYVCVHVSACMCAHVCVHVCVHAYLRVCTLMLVGWLYSLNVVLSIAPQETNKYIPPITLPVSVANGDMGLYPEQPDSVSHCGEEVDPKWEFPPDLLQLSEVLYDGFSTVLYKGTANGIKSDKAIDVAVKCCKDQASEEDVRALIADMEQLAGLGSHPNIVGLLRVCTVESESSEVSLFLLLLCFIMQCLFSMLVFTSSFIITFHHTQNHLSLPIHPFHLSIYFNANSLDYSFHILHTHSLNVFLNQHS